MIKRKNGIYLLTPFGKVIYMVQLEFVKAIDEHFESKTTKTITKKSNNMKSGNRVFT